MKSPITVATFLCLIATYLVGPGSAIAASQPQTSDAAEWGLVLVGVATLGIILYQAVETARAARATQDAAEATQASAEAIKTQIGVMERQTKATEDNAKAALLSAEAANTNIALFISKERARVRVVLKELSLIPKGSGSSDYLVEFTIKNLGLTTAFITEAGVAAFYAPREMVGSEDVVSGGMIPIHDLPGEISAHESHEALTFLFFEDEVALMLDEIREGKLFVGIRGYIKYRDVFDRDRETSFQYIWEIFSFSGIIGAPNPFMGEWKRTGPPENNQET